LRICVVSHLYPVSAEDYKGVFVHQIAAALAGRGHVVHVVTPRRPGGAALETRDGVVIHRYRHWGWRRGRQLSRLQGTPPLLLGTLVAAGVLVALAVALRHRLRLFYAYWVVPGGLIAWLCARLLGRRSVATAAGSDLNMAAAKARYRPFVTRVLRGADGVIACGSDLYRLALEMGAAPDRVRCLPSLVADAFAAEPLPEASAPSNPSHLFEPLAGGPGARLLYVGNLTPPKRVDTLLRAMARVGRERPDACLTIVGDGELREDLEALAERLGLAGRPGGAGPLGVGEKARFLGRWPHDQVPALMRQADLFVHCSDHEGLPVAIQEALAVGLPVVAAGVGGIADLVVEGRTGHLLAPDDDAGFTRAILGLLGDAERRQEMSRAARAFYEERLGQQVVIGQIERFLLDALPERDRYSD
jgi:glycosyltransferase involved in cell wall biosynthesis